MLIKQALAALILLVCLVDAGAQMTSQVELKIEPSNRTLTVSAEDRVTVDAEIAILHIGFETPPSDAKSAYAVGSKASNEIIAALKQAGIAEASIHSESQQLDSVDRKAHKFKLVQHWTVRTPPDKVAEILDLAVAAGATDSGAIDWTVEDVRALEQKALDRAAGRAKADALVLAKGMEVQLGKLVYVSNRVTAAESGAEYNGRFSAAMEDKFKAAPVEPLAIEPRKVSWIASVYAVYSIE